MKIEDIKYKKHESEVAKMLAELANCIKTYYNAGGHHKAAANLERADKLKAELIELGQTIPSDKELLKVGTFNGNGSY